MNMALGRVSSGKMILNISGKIVKNAWLWLEKQYEYVQLDEFIVMPNHTHAVIIIDLYVGTGRDLSLQYKVKSLSELIGAFKTKSSKEIHLNGFEKFQWQRSFYDRIIRTEEELFYIRRYINQNPDKWEEDLYF